MAPKHVIDVEPLPGFLRITLTGFFDEAAIARFVAERNVKFKRLRSLPNDHVCLCDVTGCMLQSQAIVEAFRRMMDDPARISRRLAFVVGGSLARMQVRRLTADRAGVELFETVAAAEAWLREERVAA